MEEIELDRPPTPPWLKPPENYERLKRKVAENSAAVPSAAPTEKANNPVTDDAKNNVETSKTTTSAVVNPAASLNSTPDNIISETLVDMAKSDTEKVMEAIERSESALEHLSRTASTGTISRTESALEQLARTASGEFSVCTFALIHFHAGEDLSFLFIIVAYFASR